MTSMARPKPTAPQAAAAHAADPLVLEVARLVARQQSDHPLHNGDVVVDLLTPVLGALGAAHGWPEAYRRLTAEIARVGAALVATGALVKLGRGKTTRYVLAKDRPRPDVVGAVVRAELRAAFRVEAMCATLAASSPGLALLGLEGWRAADALRTMAQHAPGWSFSHLAGAERVIDVQRNGVAA